MSGLGFKVQSLLIFLTLFMAIEAWFRLASFTHCVKRNICACQPVFLLPTSSVVSTRNLERWTQVRHENKERGRNHFPVKALRFGLDLVGLIEQSHRNSKLFGGLCEWRPAKDSLKLRCMNGEVVSSLFLIHPDSIIYTYHNLDNLAQKYAEQSQAFHYNGTWFHSYLSFVLIFLLVLCN